jgi:hypothetical protein
MRRLSIWSEAWYFYENFEDLGILSLLKVVTWDVRKFSSVHNKHRSFMFITQSNIDSTSATLSRILTDVSNY